MAFEKPEIERERINNEFLKGQRAAERGEKYFNPYSNATQKSKYNQFEYGWNDYQERNKPSEVITKSKYPQLAVLIVGILLTIAVWYFNS